MPTFNSKTFVIAALIVIAMIAGVAQLGSWAKHKYSPMEQVKQTISVPVDNNDVPYIFPLPDDEMKKAKKVEVPAEKGWFDWFGRSKAKPIEIPAADAPTLPEQKPLSKPKEDKKSWLDTITDSLPSLPKFESTPSAPSQPQSHPDWQYDSGARTGCHTDKDGTIHCSSSP